jgi:putative PIN family toxin of toxin-antitoxin system
MLIVLDTNVLVSALLKRDSYPDKVLDAILKGKLQIAVDERIIGEYTVVLHRPRLNIPSEQANSILSFLCLTALWVNISPVDFPQGLVFDPSDLSFAEAAIYGKAEVLITGNMKHFLFLQGYPVKVLLPKEFIKEYEHLL